MGKEAAWYAFHSSLHLCRKSHPSPRAIHLVPHLLPWCHKTSVPPCLWSLCCNGVLSSLAWVQMNIWSLFQGRMWFQKLVPLTLLVCVIAFFSLSPPSLTFPFSLSCQNSLKTAPQSITEARRSSLILNTSSEPGGERQEGDCMWETCRPPKWSNWTCVFTLLHSPT